MSTDTATQEVQIAKLARHTGGPLYHVHGATCADARKRRYCETDRVEVSSLAEAAAWVYGISVEDAIEGEYAIDLKVFPCVAGGLR